MDINIVPKEAFDLVKEVYGDIAKPSAQVAGKAVADTLRFVALPFRCLGMTVDELEAKYKEFIVGACKKVEPEKLHPSPPTIAGPVFEHIKYTDIEILA